MGLRLTEDAIQADGRMDGWIYRLIDVCIFTYTYIYIYTHIYSTHIYMHIYIYMYIHIEHIYTCIHMYIYIQIWCSRSWCLLPLPCLLSGSLLRQAMI